MAPFPLEPGARQHRDLSTVTTTSSIQLTSNLKQSKKGEATMTGVKVISTPVRWPPTWPFSRSTWVNQFPLVLSLSLGLTELEMVWNAALAGFFRANWKVGTVSWAWVGKRQPENKRRKGSY